MSASSALATQAEPGAVIPADASSIMAVIARAASDPNTDVDKLERMLGMYERITARGAEQSFNEALNDAQAELKPVAADATNPQTKSKYASYPALDRAVRPIYVKHGFSLSFNTGDGAPADHMRVLCQVSHRAGHSRNYHVDMPADGKGARGGDVMTKTHAAGSAMSYGQRYLLKMIFNIAVGEDDDGNRAGNGPTISPDQIGEMQALMEDVGADRAKFLAYLSDSCRVEIKTIADVPAARFAAAMKTLEAKRGR